MLRRRPRVVAILVLAIAFAACGGGSKPDAKRGIVAKVASYEVLAIRPQRFIVGLVRADNEMGVAYGRIRLAFAYEGTRGQSRPKAQPGLTAMAGFLPIPGQHADPGEAVSRFAPASETIGVYGAEGLVFPQVGFWRVTATANLAGKPQRAVGRFEVFASNRIPAPGDPAPRTDNPVAGAVGVPQRAIDSRAGDDTPLPDPELHSTSVAAAIAAHRPVMVVVSTPTYCQSRFCGPITDSVSALAKRYGDRMAFVHLEVWRDFDKGDLNPAAQEWIDPNHSGDGNEPWTFTIGSDGLIKRRFDNVATDDELEAAVRELLT